MKKRKITQAWFVLSLDNYLDHPNACIISKFPPCEQQKGKHAYKGIYSTPCYTSGKQYKMVSVQ